MKTVLLLMMFSVSFSLFADEEWRTPKPEDMVYLELESGTVVIELAPFMAPEHVKQFKNLVREGFYDGLDFYRVIDGFVAQAGDFSEKKASKHKSSLNAELDRNMVMASDFNVVQSPEFIAPETGYIQSFAAGRDLKSKKEWLLHCYGAVAMARDNDINSGTTDFYIAIGQAPRHLDRNMSTFGRVISGMQHVQAVKRGNKDKGGVIDEVSARSKILSAKVASDLIAEKRLEIQVQKDTSQAFNKRLQSARKLENEFFHFKGNGNLDVCYYQTKVQLNN